MACSCTAVSIFNMFSVSIMKKMVKNIQKVPLQPVCSAPSAQSRLCHQWYLTAGSRPLLKLDYQPNDTGPTLDEEAKHV